MPCPGNNQHNKYPGIIAQRDYWRQLQYILRNRNGMTGSLYKYERKLPQLNQKNLNSLKRKEKTINSG